MDKVFIVWRTVRYEGRDLLVIADNEESAREWALKYTEDSLFEWDEVEYNHWANYGMDADITVEDYQLLP